MVLPSEGEGITWTLQTDWRSPPKGEEDGFCKICVQVRKWWRKGGNGGKAIGEGGRDPKRDANLFEDVIYGEAPNAKSILIIFHYVLREMANMYSNRYETIREWRSELIWVHLFRKRGRASFSFLNPILQLRKDLRPVNEGVNLLPLRC